MNYVTLLCLFMIHLWLFSRFAEFSFTHEDFFFTPTLCASVRMCTGKDECAYACYYEKATERFSQHAQKQLV